MTEKCISCEQPLEAIEKQYGKDAIADGYRLEDGFICYPCVEEDLCEAPVLVYHRSEERPKRLGRYISGYFMEGEQPKFSMAWVPTDKWRGHYEIKGTDDLANVFNDQILSYHESEKMLKVLHDISMKAFDLTDTDYYRVFSRTSNVFCMNLDFYVEKAREALGREVIEVVKKFVNYDDPVFSTGILFPREKPAEFELGNVEAVKQSGANDTVKQLVLVLGQEILSD